MWLGLLGDRLESNGIDTVRTSAGGIRDQMAAQAIGKLVRVGGKAFAEFRDAGKLPAVGQ